MKNTGNEERNVSGSVFEKSYLTVDQEQPELI